MEATGNQRPLQISQPEKECVMEDASAMSGEDASNAAGVGRENEQESESGHDSAVTRRQFLGVAAGASMLMRMFGLAVVAGISLAAVIRRAWKQTLLFATTVTPFFLFIAWRTVHRTVTAAPVSGDWATKWSPRRTRVRANPGRP